MKLFLLLCGMVFVSQIAWAESVPDFNRLADAIKRAENSKSYPYGIKSINTHGNEAYARKICLNTIRNNWKRYLKTDKTPTKKEYIIFLGDRYCPAKDDNAGHKVWANNVRRLYESR